MKFNTRVNYSNVKNYILMTLFAATITACGGSGSSSSNMSSIKDSDGDGFYDAIDPAPHDASNPGDFSTPEKILENAKVKKALEAAKKHGVLIRADLGHNPPNLTGYYSTPVGGSTVLTESGRDIGRTYVASESRVRTERERYEKARVEYIGSERVFFTYSKGSFLRGEGNNFTIYSPFKKTCTEAGSNYSIYGIVVESGVVSSQSAVISSRNRIELRNLASSGKLTSACDSRLIGGGKNKWLVARRASSTKIDDVSDLEYMCVDGDKAYIPGEKWKNKEKESCKCTTDYDVECE